ncbi:MAG TPA: TolC family protein [Verrucomicrobiae bacterium]|jgi:outer membrane protein TolC
MKRFGIVSFFFLAIFAVTAQTNTPSYALVATNANDRWMSLQDCIQEALVHNLDVQISRENPLIDFYKLNETYGGYDPTWNISGKHSYNYTPSSFILTTNLEVVPANIDQYNLFESDVGGTLPWGLQYDFIGSIEQTKQNTVGEPGTENSPGSIQVTLDQPLLKNFWIDTTRLNIRQAKNTLQSSEQGLRLQVITSVTAVANAYYELIYAFENVQVQQEALDLSSTQLDQDQQRVDIGSLAPLSVQQDQSQVAQNKASLISAEETLSADQNTLKSLIADTNYTVWHGIDIEPTESLEAKMEEFNLQDSWNKGMSERPDLIQARLTAENQGIQLKFDRNQLFPELDAFGSYGYNGSGPQYSDSFGGISQGNAPFYTYGAKVSMPLGNIAPRNALKSDKLTLQQYLLTLKQDEQNIMVEIDNAVQTAKSDYESVSATRQARIYAEAALDAEQKTYAVGKATTFEVLTYQNNLTAARLAEIRALANYEEALATLSQQEGSTLERYGIDIDTQ